VRAQKQMMASRTGITSSSPAISKTTSIILPPRVITLTETSTDEVECSIHTLPKPLEREFRHVFGDEYLKRPLNCTGEDASRQPLELIAIPTNQNAREDLVAIGDHIEKEKDRLLNIVRHLIATTSTDNNS